MELSLYRSIADPLRQFPAAFLIPRGVIESTSFVSLADLVIELPIVHNESLHSTPLTDEGRIVLEPLWLCRV